MVQRYGGERPFPAHFLRAAYCSRSQSMLARAVIILCLIAAARPSAGQPLLPEASRLSHSPGIALVLSGGGAKGFSHIGVLEILDSAQVPIDLIVGTSIGSSIGGLYAAGYSPQQLERFAESVNWLDVLDLAGEARRNERSLRQKDVDNALLSLRFTGFFHPVIPQAISSGQRLTMLLNSMVMGAPGGIPQDFLRDMRVPFVAVTTDIVRGQRHLITSGDLTEALRSSATLPLRFSPLPEDSVILMDGGLIANIPVDVARSMGASRVLVSNATAHLKARESLNTPWDVADQVISLMMLRQNNEQLRNADLVIEPELERKSDHLLDENDFANIPALVEAGRVAARAMLPAIKQQLLHAREQSVHPAQDTLLPSLQHIQVIGTIPSARDTALEKQGSMFGLPLVLKQNERSFERQLLANYRNRGYSLARIDSVIIQRSSSTAIYYVEEGRIGRIITPEAEDRTIVMRELPFSEGEVFRAQDGEQALKNLTGTGMFDFAMVQVQPDSLWPGTRYVVRDDTPSVPTTRVPLFSPSVIVTTHSQPSNVIRLGVLANNDLGAEFSAELANENVSGTGGRLSLKGSIGPVTRFASLTIDAPNLFNNIGVLGAEIYSGYRDVNVYSTPTITLENRIRNSITDVVRESRDFGIRLQGGGQVERIGALLVQIRGEHQQWFSVRDSAESGSLDLRALRGQLMIDSRNDAAYPNRGTYLRAFAESGLKLLGGNTTYTKLYSEIEQAIPVSGLHTLIPRFRLGFGDAPLPRLELFDLGGMESFYGLNEYELRGKQMLEGSLTYQIAIPHALFFPTFVSARYDLGSVWPEPEAIKFESLQHGLGVQVGLKTPLGLARFGIGENFRFVEPSNNKISAPRLLALNKPRFYFSIGSRL